MQTFSFCLAGPNSTQSAAHELRIYVTCTGKSLFYVFLLVFLQEGSGQSVKSHFSRPASQNSVADVAGSLPNPNAAELQNKQESFETLHSQRIFTGLSKPQIISSANPATVSSVLTSNNRSGMAARPPAPVTHDNGVHYVDTMNSATMVPSSSIFEISDIASSLSGLNMSRGNLPAESILQSPLQMGIPTSQQQHYSDNARVENLTNNINYVNLSRNNELLGGPSASKPMNERVGFPRRTSSTTNLQSEHTLSDFARLEDLKSQLQNNNFPGANVATHRNGAYAVEQRPDTIIGNDLVSDCYFLNILIQFFLLDILMKFL